MSSSTRSEPSVSASALASAATPAVENVFAGGGEMGALMRACDWSKTPLGPVANWPQSLKTAVRIILTSRYAMFVWWGRELINLYNDPYRAFLGIKHPEALGKSARDVWAEIWEQIGPRTDAVLLRGESTYDEALLLLMERHGYMEETYFTFSYSPLPDEKGNIGGLFCAVTEETQQVIRERRLRLLREIATGVAEGRTPLQVCQYAAQQLSKATRDLPFSLIYLLEKDGKSLRRVAEAGIAADHPATPALVSLDENTGSVWPFAQVIATGEPAVIEELSARIPNLPQGEWNRPVECAVLVPIAQQGQKRPAGVFVAGINPYRKYDDEFRGFVSLLANQVAAGVANAVAFETERQRAEALAELDRAKTLFFSNVSHEFRTPLTLLLGPLEEVFAQAREQLDAKGCEQLALARRNALRLLKLVNTLLDFSRIEAGRVQSVYEPTDIAKLTAEIASVFRSAMEKAGLRFSVKSESIPEPVYLDRTMWEKIVLNLLSNAFKFTFEGEIAVTMKSVDGCVEVAVRDTGVGIPPDEVPCVFERFHRVENTRARSYEGTGIGLSLVWELVKLHGGTVRVESTLGRGSTFTVSIPRGKAHLPTDRIQATRDQASTAVSGELYVDELERWLPRDGAAVEEPAVAEIPRRTAAEPLPSPERELIVVADDNADMREYLGHLLRNKYRVHTAANGTQAVEAVRQLRPALVLADVMMPELDGFGVLHAIRKDPRVNSTPVILLSARTGEESRVEGLQAGADDYLVKPFTARELLARIATHMKMAKLRHEAAERESRLRAEAELQRRRLQEVLAQAPAAIGVMTGPEHRWTYVNDHYVRVTGRNSGAEFIGKTVRESLPELEEHFHELLDEVYGTGKPYTGHEAKVKLKRHASQPEDVYFDFVYQPVRDAAGQVEGILVHAVEVTDKVATRQKIEKSEERLRLAQTAAQIGTWEWDPVQSTSQLSPELHAMFGTERGDPEQMQKWVSRVHPADWDDVQRLMTEGHDVGEMEFEYRYQHPQLGLRWFYCKGRRLQGETRMFGVVQDITDRKSAEQALQQSEEEFRGLADAIPQLVWMAKPDGWIFWYNRRWYEYTGTTPEQMEGWGWQTVHDPAMLPAVLERWKSSIDEGKPFEMTFPLRGADGTFRPFLTRGVPVRDSQGKITRWFGTNTDISVEVRIQEELRQNQSRLSTALVASQRLAAIVASSDDAIVSKDLRGIVTSWNACAERMFGYTAEEMIGRSITTIIPPELHSDEDRILSTIARGERIEHFETVRVTKSGERIDVSLTISPVKDDAGNIVGAAKIARDITQRKKTEQALRISERLASVGRMAATIAHEINNPLEAVTNLIYLAKQTAGRDEVRGYLITAEEELDRISQLTKQTLGFYRETRGPSPVRIGSLIEPLLSVFASRARNKGIEVRPEIKGDPQIYAVPGEIRQLLANLVSNSIDAVNGKGLIRVRVSAATGANGERPGVRLTVADTGSGIPNSIRSHLFEPFFTTKKEVGTGLGLWVCKSIVEKHGGSIRVRSSDAAGRSWTVFSVILPSDRHTSAVALKQAV